MESLIACSLYWIAVQGVCFEKKNQRNASAPYLSKISLGSRKFLSFLDIFLPSSPSIKPSTMQLRNGWG